MVLRYLGTGWNRERLELARGPTSRNAIGFGALGQGRR